METGLISGPRVLVAHSGARHSYALPAAFAEHGLLEAFYTDACAGLGLARLAQIGRYFPLPRAISNGMHRLLARRPPDGVIDRTRTASLEVVRYEVARRLSGDANSAFRALLASQHRRGRIMAGWGLGNATHFFNVMGEGGDLVQIARSEGIPVFSDVIIALSTDQIVRAEYDIYPDWGPPPPDRQAAIGGDFRSEAFLLENTDVFVCPSDFVADDLVNNWGVERSAVRVIPYPVPSDWFALEARPQPGRVLFAGTADRRKGIHYLAMAAGLLKGRGRGYEFCVAGEVSDVVRNRPETRNLTFLGRVPRTEISRQFETADVFVLPTLAEGSATVVYEALSAGLPVITTAAAGSVVRDGMDGIIIPERDPYALADAIEAIVEDRDRRELIGQTARSHARSYSWKAYAAALVDLVRATPSPRCAPSSLGPSG